MPFFQKVSPAELAAIVILRTLEEIGDLDKNKISVIDFCSGAGGMRNHFYTVPPYFGSIADNTNVGPIPTIERIVNEKRAAQGKKPIPFVMSDLHPNLDSWMDVCSKSKGSLSFIPQSVDATNPPISAMSTTANGSRTAEGYRADSKVFRLYCLSFHHFGDDLARQVLQSTMETADGFAIVELQDRYLSSFALMFGHIPLIFATSIFRYWRDLLMLLLVYVVPVVPAINTFDGVVSCLRTRSFKEVMALIGSEVEAKSNAGGEKSAVKDDWVFKSAYEMHSWPVGYMSWVTGYRQKPTTQDETTSSSNGP